MDLTTTELLILIAVAVAVVAAVAIGITLWQRRRQERREHLKERFGPEYDRTVEDASSRKEAERRLAEREERFDSFDLQPLSPGERDRFRARWEDLQAAFVDEPDAAVRRADALIDEVASTRGYPEAGRDQRLEDLTVAHPKAVERYREGQAGLRPRDGRRPSTEQLRETFLASRDLFEALVGRADAASGTPQPPFRDIVVDEPNVAPPQPAGRGNGHRAR